MSARLAERRDRLVAMLENYGSCAVAFSGGLDSTVLAKAAHLALGDRAVAVTAVSPSLPQGECELARELARLIGIRHETVATDEMSDPDYLANTPQRCYHCKTVILRRIKQVAAELALVEVIEGTNVDDQDDHRPGRRAVQEQGVHSPLAQCGLTKADLRTLAADWGVPVWDKPASPCLASRITYGQTITPERLAMVDRAEQFLRERGFQPLRVRYCAGDTARIEVPTDMIPGLLQPDLRVVTLQQFKSLGFLYVTVDLEGFRSGSLNEVLPG